MSDKEILAALEITSHEIRLLVGEFFNTRLNILRSERVETKGMDGFTIKDPKEVATAIRSAVNHASEILKVRIERVILAIPAYRMNKESQRISKMIEHAERRVVLDDIRQIVIQGKQAQIDNDLELINLVCVRYFTNGMSTRRMPIDDMCDILDVDMDLLCADKMTAYDYVSCVEMAGVNVMDVCLDSYAVCKEMTLFEQSVDQNNVIIQLEKDRTTLSIVSQGRLEITKIMNQGYNNWTNALQKEFGISESLSEKILLTMIDWTNRMPKDAPIYAWQNGEEIEEISQKQAYGVLKEQTKQYAQSIRHVCEPFLDTDNIRFVVCGEGSEIDGIEQYLSEVLEKPCKRYVPDTLGARNGMWTTCLGMFYTYHDQLVIKKNKLMSVDSSAYAAAMHKVTGVPHGEGFTTKLKGLFSQIKN
ncbi:MAG: hypothetical protein HUJ58_06935 [Erysipelotrichaceae bacterium]|nr:hypothetical protein [Erysipelotrichaceae bacterium]